MFADGDSRTFFPFFLPRYPDHEFHPADDLRKAAKLVRGMAERGDPMCKEIFRVQAHALGVFFDEMVNTFDPDALVVGGGAMETREEFQPGSSRNSRGMPRSGRTVDIPIHVMPNGDTAGARGAAIDALQFARQNGLW